MADSGQFKKYIAEQKLKAFSIGAMGKTQPSKRELSEQKKKEEEHAAAQAFEEFVATFQNEGKKSSKVWVKAGTYDAGKRQEDTREKGKLYKPQARGNSDFSDKTDDLSRFMGERKTERMLTKKKKEGEKKKSNLELFKEELKMIQEEREERHKFKGVLQKTIEDPEIKNLIIVEPDEIKGSFDSGDPNTTNLYLGNLNPKITEAQLMEVFGKYGPLASIKIMWPRSDEEKARGRNCGFVAYMSRKDGERALKNLNGKDVMSYEMKMGWGKSVPIPPHPIYIPPALLAITLPPPHSGLPFNAQPILLHKERKSHGRFRQEGVSDKNPLEKILPQTIIKVIIPTERNLLMLIHHMIEFVIREGPLFEAMIMNKELNNPMFQFLFDNFSPTHLYYRWKLFSMLQGDSTKEWRIEEFRMFKGGSIWRPPPMNPYTVGMPDELVPEEDLITRTKGTLSISQRERFEELIRNMTPERLKVAEVMVFCVEHSDAVDEICDCIQESLSNTTTALHKKIARLYLISDVLHNCGLKVINATQFRRGFETRLISIMEEVLKTYKSLNSQSQADGFKHRVMQIFKAWEEWDIYPKEFLFKCQNTFLGLSIDEIQVLQEPPASQEDLNYNSNSKHVEDLENIDGAPLSDIDNPDNEDLDGVPLDGATLLKHAYEDTPPGDADIDGVPFLDDDIGSEAMIEDLPGKNIKAAAFVPSRWETVDPHEAEEQAMTTSKWEMLERENKSYTSESMDQDSQDDDLNETKGSTDDRRAKLRDIEVKVMQYQDELESGKRALKGGWNIYQQVEHYRRKLLKKVNKSPDKELKLDKDKKEKDRINKRLSPDDNFRDKKKKRSRSSSNSPAYSKWSSHSIRSDSLSPSSRKRPNSPQRNNNKKTRISPVDSPRTSSRRKDREREDRHNYRHKRSHSRSPHRHRARTPSTPLSHTSRKHKHKY